MIHVPVQDGGESELAQVSYFEADRAAEQVELARYLNQGAEGDSIQGDWVAAPQRVQIDAVAMVGRDHSKAG